MPTPTGLPKPGETWRLTLRLPKNDGSRELETYVHTYEVLERGTGSYWPLRVKNVKTGHVHLMVDAAAHFSNGTLKYVPPNTRPVIPIHDLELDRDRVKRFVRNHGLDALIYLLNIMSKSGFAGEVVGRDLELYSVSTDWYNYDQVSIMKARGTKGDMIVKLI